MFKAIYRRDGAVVQELTRPHALTIRTVGQGMLYDMHNASRSLETVLSAENSALVDRFDGSSRVEVRDRSGGTLVLKAA